MVEMKNDKGGAFQRIIKLSRSASHRPDPKDLSPLPVAPSDHLPSDTDSVLIPPAELRAVCQRFSKALSDQLHVRDFESAAATAATAEQFLCEYIDTARAVLTRVDLTYWQRSQSGDRTSTAGPAHAPWTA